MPLNLRLPAFEFVHPGDLATRTGGYRYARELLAALARQGVVAGVHRLSDSFPFPDAAALEHADRVLAGLADASVVVIDGLAFGAMDALASLHAARLRLVALVHHPLALETGLDAEVAARLAASERAALASARAVVVTSSATAAGLQAYGVDPSRITVVLPGTSRPSNWIKARIAAGIGESVAPAGSRPTTLLCVASITARKGHLELLEALGACRARGLAADWRLVCIGSLERDPDYVARVRAAIAAAGFEGQVLLAGERDEAGVDLAYGQADVFVLASYHEGYGMVLAEAIAHGLPVVSTLAGAIMQTVPPGAGCLVPAGDVAALADALATMIGNPGLRTAMSATARKAAAALPDWDAAAAGFLAVVCSLDEKVPDPGAP